MVGWRAGVWPLAHAVTVRTSVFGARGFGARSGAGMEFWLGSRATRALHLHIPSYL